MAAMVAVLCLILLFQANLVQTQSLCVDGSHLVRYVSENGSNTPSCLNALTPDQAKSNPCRTITYALLEEEKPGVVYADYCNYSSTPDNLCVRLEDGIYKTSGELQVTRTANLIIEAVNPGQAILQCSTFPNLVPRQWDDLNFFCSENVTVNGLVIEHCGPVGSGIYCYLTNSIEFVDCIFRNNRGVGMEFRECNNIAIRRCLFDNNINNLADNLVLLESNRIDISDLNNLSFSGGALGLYANATNLSFLMEDCLIIKNNGSSQAIDPRRPPLFQLDGHGGGLFFRLSGVVNSTVIIRNTTFNSNFAEIDGGGLFVSMSDNARENTILIEDCNFSNNRVVNTSGGAIAINLFNKTIKNSFEIRNSCFTENHALGGAAVSLVLYGDALDFESLDDFDSVSLRNCMFAGNLAEREGSAIGLFSFLRGDEIPFEVQIENWQSLGVGLDVKLTDNFVVRNCTFDSNSNQLNEVQPTIKSDDPISVSMLNQVTLSGGGFGFFTNTSVSLLMEGCHFINNYGSPPPKQTHRPPDLELNGHGGAIYLRLDRATDSNIIIRDTIIDSNTAFADGGGVYIKITNDATNNSILFENCEFYNNSVERASGGAISVNILSVAGENQFEVRNSIFERNFAFGGAAIGLVFYHFMTNLESVFLERSDVFKLKNCTFIRNSAQVEGSAMGLFSFLHGDEIAFEVQMEDCTFINNTVTQSEALPDLLNTNDLVVEAAVSSFRFPLRFSGRNVFDGNLGGGVSLVNTVVNIDSDSELVFMNNNATFGAGIQMEDRCLLNVSSGARLDFINNFAKESGGGIFARFSAVDFAQDLFNRFCLIQYFDPDVRDLPPQLWKNVSINFINNTAGLAGAALYTSNARRCSYLGGNISVDDPRYTIFTPPEEFHSPFFFDSNKIVGNRGNRIVEKGAISTDPVRAEVRLNIPIPDGVATVHPGETITVRLLNKDYFNNTRDGVLRVSVFDQEPFTYAVSQSEDVLPIEVPNSNVELTRIEFALPEYLGASNVIEVNLRRSCHPGYDYENQRCECQLSQEVIHCDSTNRYVYIREGGYAYVNKEGELTLVPGVPALFLSCQRQEGLPGCLFQFDNPDSQCASGRHGFLCGLCPQSNHVTIDLQECSDNCYIGLVIFILLCFGVIVISFVILYNDWRLLPEMRAAIFYAQVIGLVFGPYSDVIDPNIRGIQYLLNLLTFSVPIPWCISEQLPVHGVALLGYISPFIAMSVLVIYSYWKDQILSIGRKCWNLIACNSVCSHGTKSKEGDNAPKGGDNDPKGGDNDPKGAAHGLSFLGLFIYKYIADTSLVILSCRTTERGYVFLYNGEQQCTAGNFLPFHIFGWAILLLFVVPLPFLVMVHGMRKLQGCIDKVKKCAGCIDGSKLRHFEDLFNKDVKDNMGWLVGWDILRRLFFIAAFYIGIYFDSSILSLVFFYIATLTLLVHCFTKPYKEDRHNIIELLVLLNLVLVSVAYLQAPQNTLIVVLVFALTLLPFVYIICFLVWQAYKIIKEKCRSGKLNAMSIELSAREANQQDNPDLGPSPAAKEGTVTTNPNSDDTQNINIGKSDQSNTGRNTSNTGGSIPPPIDDFYNISPRY